jgi:hypothetical protein
MRILKFVWMCCASMYVPQVRNTSQMIWRFEFGLSTRTQKTNENCYTGENIAVCRTNCCNCIVSSNAANTSRIKDTADLSRGAYSAGSYCVRRRKTRRSGVWLGRIRFHTEELAACGCQDNPTDQRLF